MGKIPKNTKILTFIYTLEDPDTNEVRYIGKTISPLNIRLTKHLASCKRENNYRTNWIKSIIKKGKKPIIKMIDSCPWDESQKLETNYISQYKDNGYRLVNLTDGGEGNLGLKLTQDRKDKLLLAVAKKIYQYDLEGNFIKEFNHAVEAGDFINFKSYSKINSAAKGKRKKAGNYQWSYEKKESLTKYNRERIISQEHKMLLVDRFSIPVLQYSIDDKFIKEWESAKLAAKTLGLDYPSIINYLNGHRIKHKTNEKTGNYIWKRK